MKILAVGDLHIRSQKPKNRTRCDKNEIIMETDFCRMKLYNVKGEEIAETIFNKEDYAKIKNKKWCATPENYVITNIKENGKKKQEYLANVLLNPPKGLFVDHIDRNPLNNKKDNLRICTQSENVRNSKIQSNNRSGYIGVYFNKRRNQYRAFIYYNKENIHLGYFDSLEKAVEIRDKKAKELHGEFATLNKLRIP